VENFRMRRDTGLDAGDDGMGYFDGAGFTIKRFVTS
jgi:hypothetical protein